jgi:hypothetical protein
LTNGLSAELGVRATAITTELTARVAADASIIATQVLESKRLDDADTANFNYLSTLVSNEAKTARAAEVALGARVDFITVNVDSKKMDSLAEIVGKMNSTGVDVYTRLATIEAVLAELRGSSIYGSAQSAFVSDVPASL